MQVHQIRRPERSRRRKKIVGRGRGSGHGKRSGRGQKGQNARSGRAAMWACEGGQMPLLRRLPKVGFNSRHPRVYQEVHCENLNRFADGTVITPELLKNEGLIKSLLCPVKVLSDGTLAKKLTVQAHCFSKTALDKIKKAGGTTVALGVA